MYIYTYYIYAPCSRMARVVDRNTHINTHTHTDEMRARAGLSLQEGPPPHPPTYRVVYRNIRTHARL